MITWAFADTAELKSQNLDGVYIEAFVHSSTAVLLVSLKCLLPENQMTDAGEIIHWQQTFEKVLPSPWYDYIFHPKIKKFWMKPLWILLLSINNS